MSTALTATRSGSAATTGRIVLTHPELGIYLGSCMGLGFWTLLDSADQPSAVTFANEDEARAHVAAWDENNNPATYGYVAVATDDRWASVATLKAAKLDALLGDLEFNERAFTTGYGRA
jgi:hypothetical protein